MYVESARGQEYISGWPRREKQREKNIGRGVERGMERRERCKEGSRVRGRKDWIYGKRERSGDREREMERESVEKEGSERWIVRDCRGGRERLTERL